MEGVNVEDLQKTCDTWSCEGDELMALHFVCSWKALDSSIAEATKRLFAKAFVFDMSEEIKRNQAITYLNLRDMAGYLQLAARFKVDNIRTKGEVRIKDRE